MVFFIIVVLNDGTINIPAHTRAGWISNGTVKTGAGNGLAIAETYIFNFYAKVQIGQPGTGKPRQVEGAQIQKQSASRLLFGIL
jgi:hypothetical protein